MPEPEEPQLLANKLATPRVVIEAVEDQHRLIRDVMAKATIEIQDYARKNGWTTYGAMKVDRVYLEHTEEETKVVTINDDWDTLEIRVSTMARRRDA